MRLGSQRCATTTFPASPVIWLAETGLQVVETRDQVGLYHTLLKCRKA